MTTIADLLAAAERAEPRPLAGLVERLRVAGPSVQVVDGAGPEATIDVAIHGITADSRLVRPGWLFVAIRGAHADGHAFAEAAVRAGAAALLVEQALPGLDAPQVVTGRTRGSLADAAAWWYGDPSRKLGVVGITGTDGKTSTSFLAAAAMAQAGRAIGMIGTVETQIGGRREPNPEHSTTPEAPALQRAIRAMVLAGDDAAIVETTSHGLALERVRAIGYDIAIFTNLTHEHLELHGSFEAYRAAKVSLFEMLASGPANPPKAGIGWARTGIVNADDPAAATFEAATRAAGARLLTYGRARGAEIRLLDVVERGGRLSVDYAGAAGRGNLDLRIGGRFNAYNALAVVALGAAIGLDPAAVRSGMESLPAVPGRMDRIDAGQPFGLVVDYAHSPASLALVLEELGPAARAAGGGLIAVFGSAGERDVAKRPLMGRIAGERCRLVVLTDEDPRGEDREAILRQIAAGAEAAGHAVGRDLLLIADRRAAIREALGLAQPGDVVLLAGKGHEATILQADGPEPWDERGEALAALRELGWTGTA